MGLIEELLELGRSLQERQIQPIVVFPGSSEAYPAARYLIAAGHRRWTAAMLIGMATIDAIMIDPPTPEELVDIQYTENEDRTDFSDMERAWALTRMKQVLQDAPWEAVERGGSLTTEQADHILQQLVTRTLQQQKAPENDDTGEERTTPAGIDSRMVAQMTARIRRATAMTQAPPRPKWLDSLKGVIVQTRKGLHRFTSRAHELDDTMAMELQDELDQLLMGMTSAIEALKQRNV